MNLDKSAKEMIGDCPLTKAFHRLEEGFAPENVVAFLVEDHDYDLIDAVSFVKCYQKMLIRQLKKEVDYTKQINKLIIELEDVNDILDELEQEFKDEFDDEDFLS